MRINHRYSTRRPLDTTVCLTFPQRNSLVAKCRDVSADGMYIALSGTRLPLHQPLEISFTIDGESFHQRGFVARSDDHGIGVMFYDFLPNPEVLIKLAAIA